MLYREGYEACHSSLQLNASLHFVDDLWIDFHLLAICSRISVEFQVFSQIKVFAFVFVHTFYILYNCFKSSYLPFHFVMRHSRCLGCIDVIVFRRFDLAAWFSCFHFPLPVHSVPTYICVYLGTYLSCTLIYYRPFLSSK